MYPCLGCGSVGGIGGDLRLSCVMYLCPTPPSIYLPIPYTPTHPLTYHFIHTFHHLHIHAKYINIQLMIDVVMCVLYVSFGSNVHPEPLGALPCVVQCSVYFGVEIALIF